MGLFDFGRFAAPLFSAEEVDEKKVQAVAMATFLNKHYIVEEQDEVLLGVIATLKNFRVEEIKQKESELAILNASLESLNKIPL
jgi:hypothetical protein